MTTLDDRGKALENKFFYDQERVFRIISRRRKLLGLWAADLMLMTPEEAIQYAADVVLYGIEDTAEGAVVNKILLDLRAKSIEVTEEKVRLEMERLHRAAHKAIEQEMQGEGSAS